MQPWFMASFSDVGHPCYGQLTPLKLGIRWPVLRDYIAGSSLKLIEAIFFKLTADIVLIVDWIVGYFKVG